MGLPTAEDAVAVVVLEGVRAEVPRDDPGAAMSRFEPIEIGTESKDS